MDIKTALFHGLQIAIEFLTGRRCKNCRYREDGFCTNPNNYECVMSIYPKYFEKRSKSAKNYEIVGGRENG